MNGMEPWTFKLNGGAVVEVTAEHIETAQRLIDEGWYQVSRKYRLVARLPKGKTGIEALIEQERRSQYPHPQAEEWVERLGEGHAGDHYLRTKPRRLGQQDPDEQELDIPTFAAYRKLGGGDYRRAAFQRSQKNFT